MKKKRSSKQPLTKRDEIIRSAFEMFFKHGFHATGVDIVLANTGISKRTLYKYFRSKEALVAAIVEYYQNMLFTTVPVEMAKRSNDPVEQILYLFDLKREVFETGDFSGCFAINAKLEFKNKDKQIEVACKTLYEKLEAFVATLCIKAKCKRPEKTARQIMILFEGAIVLSQIHHDPTAAATAKEMARTILKSDIG